MFKTCILIHSSSLYNSIIESHMILFRKYWKDCPFQVFINSDYVIDLSKEILEKNNNRDLL